MSYYQYLYCVFDMFLFSLSLSLFLSLSLSLSFAIAICVDVRYCLLIYRCYCVGSSDHFYLFEIAINKARKSEVRLIIGIFLNFTHWPIVKLKHPTLHVLMFLWRGVSCWTWKFPCNMRMKSARTWKEKKIDKNILKDLKYKKHRSRRMTS